MIATADLLAFHEATVFKIDQDLLDRALGDPHACGNLTQHMVGVGVQDDEDVRMICQERPSVPWLFGQGQR